MQGVKVRFTSGNGKIKEALMAVGPEYKAELTYRSLFGKRRNIATIEIMEFVSVNEVPRNQGGR
jgi:hypothetical protein